MDNNFMTTLSSYDEKSFIKNHDINKIANVKYLGRKKISFEKIKSDVDDNPCRTTGIKTDNVQNLMNSFKTKISTKEYIPIVSKLEKTIVAGDKVYQYYLEDGFHRKDAFEIMGVNAYFFDIVEFTGDEKQQKLARATLRLMMNAPPPKAPNKNEDIINTVKKLVDDGCIKNTTKDIKKYITETVGQSMGTTRISNIVEGVVARTGVNDPYITWTTPKIKNTVPQDYNITTYGNLDIHKNKYGFTIRRTYEKDFVHNAIASYGESLKEVYAVGHIGNPSSDENLYQEREAMVQSMAAIEENLIKVFQFYAEHGRFPWKLESFLPQTMSEYEKGKLIPNTYKSKPKTKSSLDLFLDVA